MIKYIAVGVATVAGVAVLEAALVPALALGGAVLLAPAVGAARAAPTSSAGDRRGGRSGRCPASLRSV
jgi:hypothetical protein